MPNCSILTINQCGIAHDIDQKDCEDAVYYGRNCAIVSDGVSNSLRGKEAAQAFTKHMGSYLEQNSQRIAKLENAKAKHNIFRIMSRILDDLVKQYPNSQRNDFAATFIAAVYSPQDDLVTLIHAGDGGILGAPRSSSPVSFSVLSYPDNSESGTVCPVGFEDTLDRMRLLRICASDFYGILLATDGFLSAYLVPESQAYSTHLLPEVFSVQTEDELSNIVSKTHLDICHITDDISCALMYFSSNANPSVSPYALISTTNEKAEQNSSPLQTSGSKKSGDRGGAHRASKNAKPFPVGSFIEALILCALIVFTIYAIFKLHSLQVQVRAIQEQLSYFQEMHLFDVSNSLMINPNLF